MSDDSYKQLKQQEFKAHLPYDVESWYPLLKDHTAPSIFIPLSRNISEAIITYYKNRFNSHNDFNVTHLQSLNEFEKEIEKIFVKFPECFVRLSSRSPKDGMALNGKNMTDEFNEKLEQLKLEFPPQNEEEESNLSMVAVSEVQNRYLLVNNAKEIMNLLLTSERVFVDLLRLEFIEDKDRKMNLIAREFVKNIIFLLF